MKRYIFFSLLALCSCSVDYHPDTQEDSRCIIVAARLQPDSLITVRFYNNVNNSIVGLSNVYVSLKEGDNTLYDGQCDSVLRLNYHPQVGKTYSLEASHNDFQSPVSASTSIPQKIECLVNIVNDEFYRLTDFVFPANDAPLLINATAVYNALSENGGYAGSIEEWGDYCVEENPIVIDGDSIWEVIRLQFAELYGYNMLIDNVNRQEGADVFGVLGSGYYDGFMRIKPENQRYLTQIEFLPMLKRSIIWSKSLFHEIRLIAASKEYDQYCKTYYQLLSAPVSGGDFDAIVYQPVKVYSNIQGGRGIFAGFSETCYRIY